MKIPSPLILGSWVLIASWAIPVPATFAADLKEIWKKNVVDKIAPSKSQSVPPPSAASAPAMAADQGSAPGRVDLRDAAIRTGIDVAANFLREPGLRKKLHGLRAQAAMEELEGALDNTSQSIPETFLKNLLAQGAQQISREELRREVISGLRRKAEQAASESMPSQAFDALCLELKDKLAEALQKRVLPEFKLNGPKFVLAIGAFDYTSTEIDTRDIKLQDTLTQVMDYLTDVDAITRSFHVVEYDITEAEKLIHTIGGDPGNWQREDARNHMDLKVRDYHPADIFIVTGKLYEQVEKSLYKRTYMVTARVSYPIKRYTVTSVRLTTVNYFHPTRGWVTEEEDAAIGSPVQ